MTLKFTDNKLTVTFDHPAETIQIESPDVILGMAAVDPRDRRVKWVTPDTTVIAQDAIVLGEYDA